MLLDTRENQSENKSLKRTYSCKNTLSQIAAAEKVTHFASCQTKFFQDIQILIEVIIHQT